MVLVPTIKRFDNSMVDGRLDAFQAPELLFRKLVEFFLGLLGEVLVDHAEKLTLLLLLLFELPDFLQNQQLLKIQ